MSVDIKSEISFSHFNKKDILLQEFESLLEKNFKLSKRLANEWGKKFQLLEFKQIQRINLEKLSFPQLELFQEQCLECIDELMAEQTKLRNLITKEEELEVKPVINERKVRIVKIIL